MFIWKQKNVGVYIYMHVFIYIHIYMYMYICIYISFHTYICIYICIYSYIYTYIYMNVYMCTHMYTFIHTCVSTCIHAYRKERHFCDILWWLEAHCRRWKTRGLCLSSNCVLHLVTLVFIRSTSGNLPRHLQPTNCLTRGLFPKLARKLWACYAYHLAQLRIWGSKNCLGMHN